MAGSFNIAPINLYSAAGLPDPNDPTQQPAAPEQGRFGDVVDAAQMGAARSVGGILDFVGANDMAKSFYGIADEQTNQMSQRGREAMGKQIFKTGEDGGIGLGEGATDFDTWLLNFANVAGGVAATVPLGGALGSATKLGSVVGMGATGGSAATGMAMEEGRQEILKMDDNLLRESPKYAQVMQMVDQQFPDSDLSEKHLIAKASLANMVADEIRADPKQLAANFAAAAIGDPIIGKALTGARIAKGGIRAGFAKGALAEGSTEALQAGVSQYGVNEALQQFDNRQLDRGVAEAALNEGLFGGAFGGAAGAVSGAVNRGRVTDVKANDPVKVQTGNSAIDSALSDLNNNVTNAQIVVEPSSPAAPVAPAGEAAAMEQRGAQPAPTPEQLIRMAPVQAVQERDQALADEAAAATQAAFGDVANQFRQINTGTSPVQQALAAERAPSPAALTADTMMGARQAAAYAEGEAAAQATSAAFTDAAQTVKRNSDRWQRRLPVPVAAAKEGELLPPESTAVVPAGPLQDRNSFAAEQGPDDTFYAGQAPDTGAPEYVAPEAPMETPAATAAQAPVEEAVPEDLPVPPAPKTTEKGLRATKSFKDAVKWAADKDYIVEPVQTEEGWTFTVKKPEPAAAEVAAADVVAPEVIATEPPVAAPVEAAANVEQELNMELKDKIDALPDAVLQKLLNVVKPRVLPGEDPVRKLLMTDPAKVEAGLAEVMQPAAAPQGRSVGAKTRRGEVGGMMSPNEVVLTSTGRETTPFPSWKRVTANTASKVDKWLLENAAAEAEARGDKLKAKIFKGELRQKTIPQASKDEAENYLFNDEWSTFGTEKGPKFRQDAILDKPVRGMSMTLAMRAVDNQLSKLGRLGGIKVEVVPTQDQFPGMPAGMRVKGFYSPSRKTVVLIAENLANPSEVRKTLMHELLAHGGLDVVLGKEKAAELMATIAATRGKPSFDKEWAIIDENYAELGDMEKAEELFARFVENAPDRGSLKYWWQSILNKLKRWMYQAGWTQNDKGFTAQDMQNALDAIVDGFRKDRTASERASVGTSDKFSVDDVMFSREPYETMATPEVDRILQKAHKGVLARAKDLVSTSGLLDSAKSNMWAALTLGQLAEVSGKLFKNGSFKSYNETYQQYVADVQTAATEASILANEVQSWAKTDQPAAKAMFELAHDATIFGLEADPTVAFQSPLPELQKKLADLQADLATAVESGQENAAKQLRKEIKMVRDEIRDYDSDVEARRATLHKRFNALPREAQDHYRRMRDAYVKRRNEAYRFQKTELQKAVDDATADGNSAAAASAKKALGRLQQEQRIAQLSGPYFPLTRFGDYFLDMVNPQGERVFLMMESENEMKRAAAEFEKEGWSIERKGKTVQFAREDGISGEILDQLGKIVDDANLDKEEADGLRDQIYQMYLQYLPNRSLRKNLIHRKGVRGFEQDAVRAFANSMSRSSTQISRMKHLPAFNRALRDANSQVREYERTGDPGEAVRSREMMEELRKRHENIMNPQESKLSQAITGLGFSWLLGLSPAAAVINLSQTATVAAPVLSSKLNMSLPKTLALLTAEMRKIRITQSSTGEKLLSLRQTLDNPDERNAYDELEKMGIIDMTRAHDLVGLSETGGFQYGGKFHKAMSFVSKFFHNAEVINREVTAMVAYRRARENGMDHKAAVKTAAELTRESHFDYSSGNRARFMQGNVAKVAFQFKQYSQQMTYYLIRNAWRSLPWKDLTAAEKRQARAQLFGTLATTGFIGGLSALPIAALYSLINALVPDDEDDAPFNAKQEFYTFLAQNFGKDLANTVIYGAGGAGLSSRIQLNELWLRDPAKNLEGAEAYTNYVMQLLGPVAGGILPNMVSGAQLIDEGEYQKGVEKMIPKAIKDWSVAERYADEGATTLRGDVLKQDFSYLELFLQANGLGDNDVTAQYEENAALKGVADTLKRRRQTLMDRFYESNVAKDYEAMGDVNEAIERFNQKNPSISISRKNLRQSMKSRNKRNEATTKGLYLDKNLRYLEEKIDWL